MPNASNPDRFQVVVTDLIVEPLDYEREILADIADVTALDVLSEAELAGKVETVDAIMVYHYASLSKPTIDRLERCKVIVRPGVGYDAIDTAAATSRGIPVCNVPDYGTEEVADTAMAMTLSLTRGTHFLNHRQQRGIGDWTISQAVPLPRLRGRTFGIIGCGRIGSAVALRAKAFGFDVVFFDPHVPDGLDKALGIRRVDTLEELLAQSYVVSPHCPATESTYHLIGEKEIAQMPLGSYLVNTSRGVVVQAEAVVEALASKHLAGAAIDVLEHEPPSDDSPVMQAWRDPEHPAHDRFLLNPHTAYYCDEGEAEFRRKGSLEVRRALLGEPLRNRVN